MKCRLIHATPSASGAVAVLQLVGNCDSVLQQVTGRADWPVGRMRLVNLAGIDDGLAVRLTARVAQLMPHGGPRVVQRLTAHLLSLGVQLTSAEDAAIDPSVIYPEAEDRFEAIMLSALARAESPLAIDLLLDQPRRWRALAQRASQVSDEDRQRSARLIRLIDPPTVVLAGRPNVGKSTLSNALMGRSMSIALDQPGTTRDYTAGRIDLGGLVVNWHDTPGIRTSNDAIEAKSIEIARRLTSSADMLISMIDVETGDWPDLPREPDLCVINKCDLAPEIGSSTTGNTETTERAREAFNSLPVSPVNPVVRSADGSPPLYISARTGEGIPALVAAIRDHLVPPHDLVHAGPWLFDPRLGTLAVSR